MKVLFILHPKTQCIKIKDTNIEEAISSRQVASWQSRIDLMML